MARRWWAHFFFSYSFCQRACPSLLSQLFRLLPHSHSLTPRHTRGSRSTLFVFCPKTVTPHLAMSYVTPQLSCQPLLLILVLLIVLAPTSTVRAPVLVSQRMRSSTPSFHSLRNSKSRSRKSQLLRIGCPAWYQISREHLGILRPDLQRWNIISAPSLHVCASSRHMLPQHQTFPVRHDPGHQLNRLTAPQPQGPMAQDHLMTTETQDEDLIDSPAPKMNNREVPFYYDSLANNTTKGSQSGSITFGKNPTCQPSTNLSEFIARQDLCRSGLFLKHEPNVKTLLLDMRMMVSLMQLSPFCCANTNIIVRQSKSIEDREIGKQCAPLWRELADQLKLLFSDADDKSIFILPTLDARSHVLSIKDRRNGVGKPVFKLVPLGSGQTFTLVAPDLCVPGISPEVLQRILCQANRPNV